MALAYTAEAAESCRGSAPIDLTTKDFVEGRLYLLLIGIRDNATIAVPSISDDGVSTGAWTVFESAPETLTSGAYRRAFGAWMIAGATEAGRTISVDFSASIGEGVAQVIELTGHDPTTPIRQSDSVGQAGGSGSTVSITLGLTPLASSYLFGALYNEGNGPITEGPNYTELAEFSHDGSNDYFQSQVWTTPADGVVDWVQIDDQDTPTIAFEVAAAPVGNNAGAVGALCGSL